ncbi:MAG: imidazole glycerol phosphate synthase subunit HisH, partial [Acidobacteriota bacterium]
IEGTVSSSPDDILAAHKIILPGVGHFGTAMSNLMELDLIDVLNEAVLVKAKPILGICLGMELMAKSSEEGGARGLGWLDARNVRLNIPNDDRHKIPHMGWNQIEKRKSSRLLNGIEPSSEFYFAHSYHLELDDPSDLLTETPYGSGFPSAIEKGNIFGVQFHPEKSHDVGARLLKNFIEL